MKSLKFCIYVILITWKIANCEEEDDYNDAESAISLIENTEDTQFAEDFVNPFSFNYDRGNKKMLDKQMAQIARSDGICISDSHCQRELKQCRDMINSSEFDRLYTVRLINLLLSTAKFQEDGDLLTGSITLSGSRAHIQELKEFGDGKTTMRRVDAILSDTIRSSRNILTDTLSWFEYLHITIYQYKITSIAILMTLVMLPSFIYVNWSTRKVILVFIAGAFLMTYFVIWQSLIKEAELKRIVNTMKYKKPPIQCNPEEMSVWDQIKTAFYRDDQCLEYYKSLEHNGLQEVTAFDALVEVYHRVIVQLIVRSGSAVSGFINNSTEHLHFPMNIVMTFFLYIAIFVPIPLLILGLFGRIRLWFGPFCGISIGEGERNQNQRQSPMVVILERKSDGELKHIDLATVRHSIDDDNLVVGGGDSKTQKQETTVENSGAIRGGCCCKDSSNKSHVQDDEELFVEARKSEARSEEKGDGDC